MAYEKNRYDHVLTAHRQGDGAKFQMFAGSAPSSGDFAVYDANGNVAASGPKVRVAKAGTLVGTRTRLNLIEGSNVTLTCSDDSGSDEIDVTIAASGGSAAVVPRRGFTDPGTVSGNWAWINQGGASSDDSTHEGIILSAPASASASLRILKKSAPAAPYTITAYLKFLLKNSAYALGGLCFRQSSDGKLVVLYFGYINAARLAVVTYSSPTAATAELAGASLSLYSLPLDGIWMRIADDNTNRVYSFSNDGYAWWQLYSEGRTTYLTADEVGFFADSENSEIVKTTLWSWLQS